MIRPHRRSICLTMLLAMTSAGCGSSCGSKRKNERARGASLQSTAPPVPVRSNEQRAFDTLVDAVLTCPWSELRGFSPRCIQLKKFFRSDLTMNEVFLSALLDDAKVQRRWIGATGLRRGRSYRSDKKLSTLIVGAFEKERAPIVAMALADAISRIQLANTGLLERVKTQIKNHPNLPTRQRLLKHTLFYNQAELYELAVELARTDAQPEMRKTAVSALFTGTPKDRYKATCAVWNDLQRDPDAQLAALASAYLTRYSLALCKEHYDSVLARVSQRAKTGTVVSEQLSDSLRNIVLQPAATPTQKKRALTVALTLLENHKNYGPSRARALELLHRRHPRGKQLVRAHLEDKDGFVMRRAERLSKSTTPRPTKRPR